MTFATSAALMLLICSLLFAGGRDFSAIAPRESTQTSKSEIALKGNNAYNVTFIAHFGYCDWIVFNGTDYDYPGPRYNSSGTYPTGTYQAKWQWSTIPEYCPDYIPNEGGYDVFLSWNTTGSLIVENLSANPTNVTVAGLGTLYAYAKTIFPGAITPMVMLGAVVVVLAVLRIKRRIKGNL